MKKVLPLFIGLLATLGLSCSKDGSADKINSGNIVGSGGSTARFATTPTNLYTVSNQHITTYNVSDAVNPVYQKKTNLGFGVETIFPRDNKLFIGTQTGMTIMDITDSDNPQHISTFQHIRSCDPVVANDQYAFITLREGTECTRGINELQVLDISNLLLPKVIGRYPMSEPYGLALDGNNLFICDGGIKHYDISNINNLVLKKKTIIEATDVIANNGTLMVVGRDGLYQYDYSKGNLVFLSKIPTN